MQQAKKTDEDILLEVVKMGFDRDTLIESLHIRVQNEGTVAYYLLLDNKFCNSSGYLGAEFQKPMDGFNQNEGANAIMSPCASAYMDYQGISIRSQVERKWALGFQELNVCWKKIGRYNMKWWWVSGMMNNSMQSNHYFEDELTIVETDAALILPNVVKFEVQVLVLLYNYFAATEIYNAIRVFIAAYVWMTGFGNFSYYYIHKDFSVARFAQHCQARDCFKYKKKSSWYAFFLYFSTLKLCCHLL